MNTIDDLRRVAETVTQVTGLPGVPTTDWSARAGEALQALGFGDVTVAILSSMGGEGAYRSLATGDEKLVRRIAPLIDPPGPETETRVRTLPTDEGTTICGMLRVGAGVNRIWLVLEAPVGRRTPSAVERAALMLEAVLPALRARFLMAFGDASARGGDHVTPSEQRVLEQLVLGRSVVEIAAVLSRSPHTVHDHVKSLHRKFGANSRGQLVARALGHAPAPI